MNIVKDCSGELVVARKTGHDILLLEIRGALAIRQRSEVMRVVEHVSSKEQIRSELGSNGVAL